MRLGSRVRSPALTLALWLMVALGSGCSSSDPSTPPPPPPPPPGPPPPPPPPPANTVSVTNDQFTPQVLNVSSGTQVNFVWGTGSVNHNVTPVPPATAPSSGNLPSTRNAPFSFQVTFPTPGTFHYFCSIHGAAGAGMHGSIVVQ